MQHDKDIWIIVFDDDTELYLLETSLYFYNLFDETTPINIIINELDYYKCESICNRLYALNLSIPITIYHADELLSESELIEIKKIKNKMEGFDGFGWIVQQYLKLIIHRKSKSEYSYILDCKNIPIKQNAIEMISDYHSFEGSGYDGTSYYNDFKIHLRARGILKDNSHCPKSVMTPFIFKNSILKCMDTDLDIFNKIFSSVRDPNMNYKSNVPLVSEIILYYSYIRGNRDKFAKHTYKNINWHIENSIIFDIMAKNSSFEDLVYAARTYDSLDLCTIKFENMYYISVHRHVLKNSDNFKKFVNFIKRVKNTHHMT